MSDVVKVAGWLPVSQGLMIDGLPFRTLHWGDSERAAEYLSYDQSVTLGASAFTAATVAENIEYGVEWDEDWFLPYLDWPDECYC